MKRQPITQKVNNSRIVSHKLSHQVFQTHLRGELNENDKVQPIPVPNKISTRINKEKNEISKKTKIIYDNDEKEDTSKQSHLKFFEVKDNLKNFKDITSEPKRLSNIRLKQDMKENGNEKKQYSCNTYLNKYESFYNDKPKTFTSKARKMKLDSIFKGSSIGFSSRISHNYDSHCSKFNTIGGDDEPVIKKMSKEILPTTPGVRGNWDSLKETLNSRHLTSSKLDYDKVTNQSGVLLTESANEIRKNKDYKPKKTFSYAFNTFTDKTKTAGFYC